MTTPMTVADAVQVSILASGNRTVPKMPAPKTPAKMPVPHYGLAPHAASGDAASGVMPDRSITLGDAMHSRKPVYSVVGGKAACPSGTLAQPDPMAWNSGALVDPNSGPFSGPYADQLDIPNLPVRPPAAGIAAAAAASPVF